MKKLAWNYNFENEMKDDKSDYIIKWGFISSLLCSIETTSYHDVSSVNFIDSLDQLRKLNWA